MTPDLAKAFGIDKPGGVLIAEVARSGKAASAGLQPGQLVSRVNRKDVNSVSEFQQAVAQARQDDLDVVVLLVTDGTTSRFVTLSLTD